MSEQNSWEQEITMRIIRNGRAGIPEKIILEEVKPDLGETASYMDMSRIQYPVVDQCIYCGQQEDLRREHIIPYGLNGTAVLQAASCGVCAAKTSACETKVLRGLLRAFRAQQDFQSSSKHEGAPRTLPLKIVRSGVPSEVQLPLKEVPIPLFFPILDPPRSMTGQPGGEVIMTGVAVVYQGPKFEDVKARLGAEEMSFEPPGKDEPIAFARMIAKIAFAAAFAAGDLGRILEPSSALPAILGEVNDIGRWVGTVPGTPCMYPGLLHRISVRGDEERNLLVAEVQLFANSGAPSYHVVLGTLHSG